MRDAEAECWAAKTLHGAARALQRGYNEDLNMYDDCMLHCVELICAQQIDHLANLLEAQS